MVNKNANEIQMLSIILQISLLIDYLVTMEKHMKIFGTEEWNI